MIQITEDAINNILSYFEDREIQPVRVFFNEGGWRGGSLQMALDDAKETDFQHEDESGVIIIVDTDLGQQTGEISIDWTDTGFNIQTENTIGPSGGSPGCEGCSDGGGTACPGTAK